MTLRTHKVNFVTIEIKQIECNNYFAENYFPKLEVEDD